LVIRASDASGPDPFERSRTMAFACHGCGECCKGSALILSPFDLARLASHEKLTPRALLKERLVLLKHPQTQLPAVMMETVPACSFLDEANRCTVYGNRPLVCRGYPLGVLTDLNQPGWRSPLQRFSIRANPCPAPKTPDFPLPMVRTLHQMSTGAGMEPYAEAYRVWARFVWDIATRSRYPSMSVAEVLSFDREFTRTFYEELEAPEDEGQALVSFVERVRAYREKLRLYPAVPEPLSTPPAAPTA
jgi:Fe-S-cluster containining protein